MAVIYAYPTVVPELQDLLIGTEMAIQGGEDTPRTRTFTIQSIIDLVETAPQTIPTLQQVTTAGPTTTVGITATTNANALTPIKGINTWDGDGAGNSVGVYGESNYEGIGVKGVGNIGYGVYGYSGSSAGVYGISAETSGVRGFSYSPISGGVSGTGTDIGVDGFSAIGIGVKGVGNNAGVYGNGNVVGVDGYSEVTGGIGVRGVSDFGVRGEGNVYGVQGVAGTSGTGIGTGVYGAGGNYGVHGVGDQNAGGFFTTANGTLALISDGPAAKPGGGAWDTYSDSRIKQNVTPYTKGLAEILLVNTVNFEYNGLANTKAGIGYVGIIAQDMKHAFPETVSTYKTKLNKEDEEETELYMFNANALTFALINAVKQLNAEIELLKSK